jgi:hypothetical protein
MSRQTVASEIADATAGYTGFSLVQGATPAIS